MTAIAFRKNGCVLLETSSAYTIPKLKGIKVTCIINGDREQPPYACSAAVKKNLGSGLQTRLVVPCVHIYTNTR